MNLKVYFADFRLHVAFTLTLIWLLAVWHLPAGRQASGFIYPLLAVGVVTITDLVVTFWKTRKFYVSAASLVTGYLIGLVISPTESVWAIILAGFLASLSKQFIAKGPRQHIFNPAVFGIVTTSILFKIHPSWWGVAWSGWPLLILVPFMARILWRMKRLYLPISFLIVYFIFLSTKIPPGAAAIILIDGSVLLFALVMLPEPITSPNAGKFKYFFGLLVAIVAILLSQVFKIEENFLPALLVSNLLAFLIIRASKQKL